MIGGSPTVRVAHPPLADFTKTAFWPEWEKCEMRWSRLDDKEFAFACDRMNIPTIFIFITGHGDVPQTVRAMKAGAGKFLSKPFNDEELLGAIRHAIEPSRSTLSRCSL